MSSYSLPSSSFFSANAKRLSPLLLPNKSLRLFTVHSFQDEGRSTSSNNNIVDENMSALKERMEMVKVKERLERCCRCEIGWNYSQINEEDDDGDVINSISIMSRRNRTLISDLAQMVGLVCGTVGSTCLSGTLLLCLISLMEKFMGYEIIIDNTWSILIGQSMDDVALWEYLTQHGMIGVLSAAEILSAL